MISIAKKGVSHPKLLPKHVNNRLAWVDYARGLAIILVVYRHSMIGLKRTGIDIPNFLFNIQEFVLNVRMPVFFVLSGIFLGKSLENKQVGALINKKIKTLLYPYLVWAIIMISFQILLSNYTNSNRSFSDFLYVISQPRELDHMWYLLALFNTTLLYILISRLTDKFVIHVLIALGLNLFHSLVSEYSLFSDLCYYYIFLALGVFISKIIMDFEILSNSFLLKCLILILPFFIAGQLFWLSHINDKYEPFQSWYRLPFLIIVLIACLMFYFIARLIFNSGAFKWLNTIGRSSLYIYILHILVIFCFRIFSIQFLHINNIYFIIGGSLLFGITIPILVFSIADKWQLFHYLFSLEKPANKNK